MYRIPLTLFFVFLAAALYGQEAPPPATEVPETPPAAPASPPPPNANSFVRLAHPAVAARIGLTDNQRAEVQRILVLRSQELAKAPETQWNEIIKQNEQQLENVLTPSQKAVLPKVFSEKTIRINFKLQSWADVLQWFSEQAGLQLVMDAPPPGTFNYADQQEYTPTEAINLLNSVLQTKGYTLIRNDKMLLLFDLRREGKIPVQFLSKLKPEELPERGTFEYVSVVFPLERRDQAIVLQALEPFKGPFCQIIPMPGNSLLITDTAGTLLSLQKVIAAIEQPEWQGRRVKGDATPVPPPVWKTYTVEKNNPNKLEIIFKEFVPSIKSLRVENSQQIHILTHEWEHVQIAAILKMLEEDSGAERSAYVLVSYPLAPYLDQNVSGNASALSPPQTWRLDRARRRALPAEAAPLPQNVNSLMMMSPTQILGSEIIPALQKSFPNAIISDTPIAEKIVVLASSADHEKIKEFFESLQPTEANQPVVKLYRYNEQGKKMNETARQQLQSVVPTAVFTLDEEQGQILVVALEKEHEQLAKAVAELEAAVLPAQDKILQSYRLPNTSFQSFATLIQQLAAQRKLLGFFQLQDAARGQVLIWATEKQHGLIQKVYEEVTGQSAKNGDLAPVGDTVVLFSPKNIALETLIRVLEDIYPAAKITTDAKRGQVVIRIRPDQKEALQSLLAQLDAADPDKEKRYFKSYPIETGFYSIKADWDRYAPVHFVADLQKLAPQAKISFDAQSQELIVWGTDEEHKIIAAAVQNLVGDGKEKKFGRFPLRRTPPHVILPIIRRMYPSVIATFDTAGECVIVEGHPKLLTKIGELIETLDPVEQTANDPVVRFYALTSEPTPVLIQGLRQLVPAAHLFPDKEQKQLMVIAKPAEQKIIEENTKIIVSTFTAPEEPMLCIYPATSTERERIAAFIRTAAADLRGVAVVPDQSPQQSQVSIWAKPSEHKLIAAVLEQFQASQTNTPNRQLKVFPMSIGDMTTAQEVLRVSHPDAMVFVDRTGNRLLVWATAEELGKVTKTLTVQGSIDDRKMLAYPIAGVKPETVKKVIMDVFQGLKITEEPQTRRILVWASPEEHVKVAEIVEQANKEAEPDSELAEKFVAYSAANLDAAMVMRLFKTMIPEADVYAEPAAEKITVRARTREHDRIRELFDQLREKDETLRPQMVVYPFGETDPLMIEAMLRSQLKEAESMTSDDLVERLGWSYYMERMPWYRMNRQQTQPKKGGYFKVDPQTQSAYVFVTGDQQKEVSDAMKQVIAAGNQEGVKPVVRRYALDEMGFYDVYNLLSQVAPSARFEAVYTYNPSTDNYSGRRNSEYEYRTSYRDFLAYARESDHEKISVLVKELNDRAGASKKEMLPISLPDKTAYSRDKIIETIQKVFPDVNPMPGGSANQILVWAPKHRLEQIQKIIAEVCKPLPEGEQTIPKAYPLQYISVEEATAWLSALYPNASFDPAKLAAAVQASKAAGVAQNLDGSLTRRRYQRPADAKFIVVVAAPLEQIGIEETIKELDKDLPDSYKMVPRVYTLDDMPPNVFYPFYGSLNRAFPNTVCTPSPERMTVMVVATDDDHKKVADFIKAYRDDNDRKRPSLEVYALKRQNYYKVFTLIQRIAPSALIFPGSKPEQIAVWGTPKEQLDVSSALTKLETAADTAPNQSLKVYKTGSQKAVTARTLLTHQFPGALVFEISPNEILAWAGESDHESIAAMLQTVAEAFPEPALKPYYFKNVPLGEAAEILRQAFIGQATLTPRPTTGDLLVFAPPEIHTKISESIKEFDIPRPAEAESMPVAYDLTDLPAGWLWQIAWSIREAMGNRVQVMPSVVPGQLVVWGNLADQKKVKAVIDQMLNERSAAAAKMQMYSIQRGTVQSIEPLLRYIAPNAQFGYGTNPNQIMVWSKESDHAKIKETIDKLNEADPDMKLETYSLKNIYEYSARMLLQSLIREQGLDIKLYFDTYSKQLVVQAKSADQKTVGEVLEKLRTEDRDLAVFTLENVDPITAQTAVYTLFYDEPYATTPGVEIDQNTNMIFVQGTKDQISRVRKMLIEMGENIREPNQAVPQQPAAVGGSNVRVLQLRGGSEETIRELEKLWKQTQPNKLQVIKEGESPTGLYSLNDEVRRESGGSDSPQSLPAAVYMILNEDRTITVSSQDKSALDRLELLLKRIDSGVVFEGRDYTIYSVRNISADVVAMKLQLILRSRIMAGQQIPPVQRGQSFTNPIPLTLTPDLTTNTIYVRGPRVERQEVAKLIALLDVSELPGERMVRRPIKVPIQNTQASRVYYQVMNVYQQKMMMTRLPGGVYPRIIVDALTNSLEIIAPEPLATELKEYAEDIDRRVAEEPGRKIHVIQLGVKSSVIESAIQRIRQSSGARMSGQ